MRSKMSRKSKFFTDFTKQDIENIFQNKGSLDAILSSAQFSLSWFIEQVCCNQQGKSLRLEAFQTVMLNMFWNKKFPMIIASRGASKTFILGLYALIKCILVPGTKVVIVGAGYRQAKLVFKEIHKIYEASPILQEALSQWGGPKYGSDSATFRIGNSTITALPIGDGEKVRGQRATVLLADEFGAIPEETFEVVLSPFTAVHADPARRAMAARFVKRLISLGADEKLIELIKNVQDFGNQVIVSGTGTHRQNHFHKRFITYKAFIESKGDPKLLRNALEQRAMAMTGKPTKIPLDDIQRMSKTWKHYAIMKLPYQALPEDFMDEDSIRNARAATAPHIFAMEFEAEFPSDTDGFIKRTWIERSTPRLPDAIPVVIELFGDPKATYVLGLDPARWNDNFGAAVLKLTPRGKELVFSTSWNRTEHNKSAEYIREICRRFNIAYIAMDKGGGGDAIIEWLCKKQPTVKDAELIWPIPDQLENKADLAAPGKKILELVNFASWATDAAHNLEAAITQCNLLFPYKGEDKEVMNQYKKHFNIPLDEKLDDSVKEELFQELWGVDEWEVKEFKKQQSLGIFNEINECINETCAIVRDTTEGGTERFILPKMQNQPEGNDMRRRDRFSALLLANYAAKVYLGHGHRSANIPGMSSTRTRTRRLGGRGVRSKGQCRY